MESDEVKSPCVHICRMAGRFCFGCGRTIEEIRLWPKMSEGDKTAVIKRIKEENFKGLDGPTPS